MKVYLLIEYGGEYGDYSERIVAGFLNREKAEEKKQRQELIEIERRKCEKCPLYYCPDECNHKCGDECSAKNMTDDAMREFVRLMSRLTRRYITRKNVVYQTDVLILNIHGTTYITELMNLK